MSVAHFELPLQQQDTLQGALQPGERVRWVGRPNPVRAVLGGLLIWLFFIPWTAFSVFWVAAASGFRIPDFSDPTGFFPLFGLPFVLIGLGGLSSPLWAYLRAQRTVHAITDTRALTVRGGRSVEVTSWSAAEVGEIRRIERPDGSGDLLFATERYRTKHGTGTRRVGFTGIPDVRTAEAMLRRLVDDGR